MLLLVTTDCNLRCRYFRCRYANGGNAPIYMGLADRLQRCRQLITPIRHCRVCNHYQLSGGPCLAQVYSQSRKLQGVIPIECSAHFLIISPRTGGGRIGVMGTVARSVLNKMGLKNDFEFGVTRAATMAALRGLNVLVLSVGRMANRVIEELERVNVDRSVSVVYALENGRIHK